MSTRPPAPPSSEPSSGAENPDRGRLLRVVSTCPRCGSRPAMRVGEEAARLLRDGAPGARLGTYQCQRRGCGTIYDLFAGEGAEEGEAGVGRNTIDRQPPER